MSEEKDLIKKRGSFKGKLTIFVNYLEGLVDASLNSCEVGELRLRLERMELLYDQYDEVQSRLECIVDDVKSQMSERSDFDSLYYKSLSRAKNILTGYNIDNESLPSNKSARASFHKSVKLPTIQLPKFNGLYGNWLEFRDTFISLIHDNDDIDTINKFHYLRASLEGSAAVVIQSIEFSSKNYSIAWKLICDRFDNKRLLIQNHVAALFNIEAITKESSVNLKGLIDLINKNLRALETLGEPVKQWDTLLIYIVTRKLDHKTFREWEEFKGCSDKDSPILFEEFMQFIRNRADLVETLELSRNNINHVSLKSCPKLKSMVTTQCPNNSNITKVCPKCKGDHKLINCSQFLAMTNEARLKLLPTYKVCFNCFSTGHFANQCKKPCCKLCRGRHNTLVHVSQAKYNYDTCNDRTQNNVMSNSSSSSTPPTSDTTNVSLSTNVSAATRCDVLLSTALVKIRDHNNYEHVVRAVLDSGSTSSFITEKLCTKLNLSSKRVHSAVCGINNVSAHVGKICQVSMTSLNNSYSVKVNCFVLPLIINDLPCRRIDISGFNIPSNICLADPSFYEPSDVDLLIGADLFWDLLCSDRIKLGVGLPNLCDTKLGWIVSGPIYNNKNNLQSITIQCNLTKMNASSENYLEQIRSDLIRFWNLEEINSDSSGYMPEEKLCEEHFIKNTTRLPDGRFCVRIPMKQSPSVLGKSFTRAVHCLQSLERRLVTKTEFSKMYHDFMNEYEVLNHMTENKKFDFSQNGYFIPHHGILRESSSTTKLRVVFNASSPSSTGVSYNDIQMVGPTVQDDLLSILLRFRQYTYVLSADVEKMYRQIVVHPSDRQFQQIVWRNDATCDPVKVYTLNTVTYGTSSAPFLATRCLKQLGMECKNDLIADVIKHDFYVDDLLTGSFKRCEIKFIRTEVTKALASAGMQLRKWKSNVPQLVSEDSSVSLDLNMDSNKANRLLGLDWFANSDELSFLVGSMPTNGHTKRDILSVIARIFDPLGLLSPIVVSMKILLQKLWLDKISWDDPLSPELDCTWKEIIKELPLLNDFRIPRTLVCESFKSFELHIFTDASESAYGACGYVRSINDGGECTVRLLMAKSRVAPIKPTTIPRLELCGAVIGARICNKILNSLRLYITDIYMWTDSTIVLGWLQMLPAKLQPFVRNRVAEILDKAGNCTWRHVPTDKNPADLISRGSDISTLKGLDLWWNGPRFLRDDQSCWPSSLKGFELDSLPETRELVTLSTVSTDNDKNNSFIDFKRFSNYLRLVRATACVIRFIKGCKKYTLHTNYLSSDELHEALNVLISNSQKESFPEYSLLLNKQTLPKRSALLKYNVYLDENKIMRVGGRLNNSNFDYNKKHPMLLQSTHEFTKLLFRHEHIKLFHAGPQLLLASIRETYWPIGGRNLAKNIYHRCVRCHRMKGKVIPPLMGNLPQQRLIPGGHPFTTTGVDYAGPISCASRQGRGCRLVKVYIAIFICFTTKAVHLELVGDLTSNKYLLALYRFISRRGKPNHIYSDNGTSFVGAYNDLSRFLKSNCSSLAERLVNDGIIFHFIPKYTPHFGGLWEAGVKSTKYHLRRVLGNCNLTYEELNTILTQIEAILNSRPLTPLSAEPDDYTPLTPGHFLIGRPLTSLPHPDYQESSISHLSRFQRIELLRQHFWARWSKEFVAELQQRVKWRSCNFDVLKLNSLVVVKEENLPPLKWRLGRVVAIHPGSDGIVRVADIKTSSGIIRRAFNNICPLPVPEDS